MMRADPTILKRIGRAIAFVLVGMTIVATAIGINKHNQTGSTSLTAKTYVVTPLSAELERCRNITQPEDVDDSCRAAWAKVRQHFFQTHDEAQP